MDEQEYYLHVIPQKVKKASNTEAILNNLFGLINSFIKGAIELLTYRRYYLIYPYR